MSPQRNQKNRPKPTNIFIVVSSRAHASEKSIFGAALLGRNHGAALKSK
jgi:hypothetical protein